MSLVSSSTSSLKRNFLKEYVYPDWFTAKKYNFYEKMLKRLDKLTYVHSTSAEYYSRLNMRIFGPSITITAFSSIASFMSTASFMDDGMRNGFAVTVGVLATVSTMMQSLASALGYSAKVEAHRQAAEEYNKLIVRLKFEMEMPNEEGFCDDMETQILEIQNKCKYFPPQFIVSQYDKMKLNKKLNKLEGVKVDNMIDQVESGEVDVPLLSNQNNNIGSYPGQYNNQMMNLQPFTQNYQNMNQNLNQGINNNISQSLNQASSLMNGINTTSQMVNRGINQATNQANQIANQATNQVTNQTSQIVNQATNQVENVNQVINETVNQAVNETVNQVVNQQDSTQEGSQNNSTETNA